MRIIPYTYKLTETVRLIAVQTRQNSCTEKGSKHCVLLLTKKLFATEACWERENQFSAMLCLWVYQPHSGAGPMPGGSRPTQNELFFCVLFCFALVYLFLGFVFVFALFWFFVDLIFIFTFSFSFLVFWAGDWEVGEKEHKIGWVGRWRRPSRSWGRERMWHSCIIQLYYFF